MIASGTVIESTSNDSIGGGAAAGGGRGPGKKTRKDATEKPDATAFATLEMSKVNNTLNAFVGGKQRSWMWNQNAVSTPGGLPVQTTIRSQINPIKRKTTPLNKRPSQPASEGRNTSIITVDDQDSEPSLLATVGPGESPPSTAPSSLSPDLRGTGLPPKRIRLPGGNMEVVLPSPAPSDTPSVADRRDEEVVTPATAQDTPTGEVDDNEQDQRHGKRQDEHSMVALDTRGDQAELSSGNTGERDMEASTRSNLENHTLLQTSAKRLLEAPEDVENSKRRKQTPLLLSDDVVSSPIHTLRSCEEGSGTSLGSRVQSPVIIDSRQASPICNQPNTQPPPIPQNETPTVPSNASPVTAPNHPESPLRPLRTSSGGGAPLLLHYSTTLPPEISSHSTQSSMLAGTSSPYSPSSIAFSNIPSDQNSLVLSEVASHLQTQGMPSPNQVRQQQQQQQPPQRTQHVLMSQQQQHPVQAPLAKLVTHLPGFDHYIRTEAGTGLRQFNPVECFRFRRLREAINKEDWFFTVLNQTYALMSTAEDTLYKETKISALLPGFQILPDILYDNQRLCGRNLTYLAAFPMPISEAKLRVHFFPALLERVKAFLNEGYKIIARMKEFYFNAGRVPADEELGRDWRIESPILRHILARYLQHHVTKLLEAARSGTLEQQTELRQLLQHQHDQLIQQQLSVHHRNQQMQQLQLQQPSRQQPQNTPQNIPPQNISPQNIPLQNIPPQNIPPQNIPPQNIPPQNIPPQNIPSQNIPPQNIPSQNIPPQNIPPQNQNYQTQLASYQQLQYQQIAMNHHALSHLSSASHYNITPNPPPTPIDGATQSAQINREYLQTVNTEQAQLQRPIPQRATSQGQRLSNPNSLRGTSLSIDTQRAQQLARNQGRQPGSVSNSPMPTPSWFSAPSPQYMGSPVRQQASNGVVNRVPQSPNMQQQYNQSGLPSPSEVLSRRNSQVQLQRQGQIQQVNTGRRVASTPAQQPFVPPQPHPPIRRQSYTQSHPMMVPDAVLNSLHAQPGQQNWTQQINDAPMQGYPTPPHPNQISQPVQQQRIPPPHDETMPPTTAAGALPVPHGVVPIPMPVRQSYAGLPQHALQSHLLSPRFAEPPRVNGKPPSKSKLYISISGFAFPGVLIDFKNPCEKIAFNINEDIEKRLSKMRLGSKPGDGLTRPMVTPGSLIYRLRSIKWTKHTNPLAPDKEWVSQETDWPSNTFIEVNGLRVELRRKPAWGRDLPADITSFIKAGDNEIKIAVLRPRQTADKNVMYAMAVEVHECRHEDDISSSLHTIPPTDAKTLITRRLVTQSADGDDLMVVDSDQLSLAITCPLSFTLMNKPVRGRSCTHLECFDFKNFLDSRPRRKEWEPPNSDAWRCPICRGDARPGELVIDGFLVDVLKGLKETDTGADDPRHILIKKDGSWEAKSEKENTSNEKSEESTNNFGVGGCNPKKEVEIICLDD